MFFFLCQSSSPKSSLSLDKGSGDFIQKLFNASMHVSNNFLSGYSFRKKDREAERQKEK